MSSKRLNNDIRAIITSPPLWAGRAVKVISWWEEGQSRVLGNRLYEAAHDGWYVKTPMGSGLFTEENLMRIDGYNEVQI